MTQAEVGWVTCQPEDTPYVMITSSGKKKKACVSFLDHDDPFYLLS